MKTATTSAVLPCAPDHFWSSFLDESSLRALYVGELQSRTFDVLELSDTTRALRIGPKLKLPAPLAKLIGEKEFSILFHEGRKDNIHISIVGQRLILVVIFDERSSLGLVRLRVRKASSGVERILDEMELKAQRVGVAEATSPFAEITDEDIDALFSE